jgi:hypothetical protein
MARSGRQVLGRPRSPRGTHISLRTGIGVMDQLGHLEPGGGPLSSVTDTASRTTSPNFITRRNPPAWPLKVGSVGVEEPGTSEHSAHLRALSSPKWQTCCKAGTQSHGTHAVSRVTEQRE